MFREHFSKTVFSDFFLVLAFFLPCLLWGPQAPDMTEMVKMLALLIVMMVLNPMIRGQWNCSASSLAGPLMISVPILMIFQILSKDCVLISPVGAVSTFLPFFVWGVGLCFLTENTILAKTISFPIIVALCSGLCSILIILQYPTSAGPSINLNLAAYISVAGIAACLELLTQFRKPEDFAERSDLFVAVTKGVLLSLIVMSFIVLFKSSSRGAFLAFGFIAVVRLPFLITFPMMGKIPLHSAVLVILSLAIVILPFSTLFLEVNTSASFNISADQPVQSVEGALQRAMEFLKPLSLNPFGSVAARLSWWRSAVEIGLKNLLTGMGPGSFQWVMTSTGVPSMPSTSLSSFPENPHNFIARLLSEGGLPLFGAGILLLFNFVRVAMLSLHGRLSTAKGLFPVTLVVIWLVCGCFSKFWSSGPMLALLFLAALDFGRYHRYENIDSFSFAPCSACFSSLNGRLMQFSVLILNAAGIVILVAGIHSSWKYQRALHSLRKGDLAVAASTLSEAFLKSVDASLLKARCLHESGNSRKALEVLDMIPVFTAQHPGILSARAILLASMGNFPAAMKMGASSVVASPFSIECRMALCTALIGILDWNGAWIQSEEALKIHPDHPSAHIVRARVEEETGGEGDALSTYLEIMRRADKSVKGWRASFSDLGQIDEEWIRAARVSLARGGRIALKSGKIKSIRQIALAGMTLFGPVEEVRVLIKAGGGIISGSDYSKGAMSP
ncbi:MAG: hypothetical protein CVV64_04330 [Candidatus Wallbacteria bacterium HGW-Wallbacteria-1]|jgi:hypothetical protein|uniref:O-antigen ligase-related domain-containing protein n=1 Tax=Candidatus Wallbacteria bacterium HGW-Wallbacteria-1 TaxID=2013854 RepID=A0A2N1PRN6_9BACT|nr:MAG: hypothetical protein CVV64_04330 [Candidatus Wallbacteria bacterium HGW-Wallbacteria-1]